MDTDLIGVSQNIREIKKIIDQVADTELDILVFGETGVGKEPVVRSLYSAHNTNLNSTRSRTFHHFTNKNGGPIAFYLSKIPPPTFL